MSHAIAVQVSHVTKIFPVKKGDGVTALAEVSLTVNAGEFVSLIGPSGCGKSTLLRLIADLDQPTSGAVTVFGKPAHQARLDQDYGIAFQSAGLLPWRTVEANIELPLQLHRVPAATRRARVAELMSLVGLSDFAANFRTSSPAACSSGSRLRGRSPRAPSCCSWTSRSARSTR